MRLTRQDLSPRRSSGVDSRAGHFPARTVKIMESAAHYMRGVSEWRAAAMIGSGEWKSKPQLNGSMCDGIAAACKPVVF